MSAYRLWISNTDRRIYPVGSSCGLRLPGTEPQSVTLSVPRGGRCSAQAAVMASGGTEPVPVLAEVNAPDFLSVRVRRVGSVQLPHFNTGTDPAELDGIGCIPGMVPDPLYDQTDIMLAPQETAAFWLTVSVDPDAPVGPSVVTVTLYVGGSTIGELDLVVDVSRLSVGERKDFPVTHWFYSDCLLDWYGLEPFDEGYWRIVEPYMRNLKEHGTDVLYVPLFTPPTDGERRPSQLLEVSLSDGEFSFDFRDVARYVRAGKASGFERFEWPHLFSQWGAQWAVAVYEGQGRSEKPLWAPETGATSETYRRFLAGLLPELKRFLDSEGIAEHSHFHVSDEPHGEEHKQHYIKARAQLRQLAPWMRTMDAVSELEYGEEGLTDMPVPTIRTVMEYIERNIDCFTYFCCSPRGRYVNRLLDTPLPKIRMTGWLLYRFSKKVHGFLHWGYNYWYQSQTRRLIDPFVVTDGLRWPGWAYGDTFVVYPGKQGPIDSIRWELFAEGLQDFAILQAAGIDPDDMVLSPLKSFAEFPRGGEWQTAVRNAVLERG